MKTPAFWNESKTLSTLLLPLAWLYEIGATLHRILSKPQKLSVPIICVGNLTAGGSGKTPVALSIGQRLKENHVNAFFLSRGYGGSEQGPIRVDTRKHTAHDVGDEPLLLARLLPTIVAKDRLRGAQFAIEQGAKLIVMDDGLQNYAFEKNLSLLVVDGTLGFGNGRLLPAGPLREQPSTVFRRTHAIVLLNHNKQTPPMPANKPVLYANTQAKNANIFAGSVCIAFCGIAHPEKFFSTLRASGAHIVKQYAFADHHIYSAHEINEILTTAKSFHALAVTTSKDAARLSADVAEQIKVLDLDLVWDSLPMLDALLENTCKN